MKWLWVLAVSVAGALAQPPAPTAPTAAAVGKGAPANPAPAAAAPAVAAKTAPPTPAEAMRAAIQKQRSSVEKQREAARKQARNAGTWLRLGDPAPPIGFDSAGVRADCEPLADAVMTPLIETSAKAHEVTPALLRAVIERESGFRPCAVSHKGAQGLMQLMPETSQELGVIDPFDPKDNVAGGAKYLKQLMEKYQGDLSKALGAYNAGMTAVDQAGGVPDIPETKDYVDAILKKVGVKPPVPPSTPTPKPTGN